MRTPFNMVYESISRSIFDFCFATTGVCVFRAVTLVAALFIKPNEKNRRMGLIMAIIKCPDCGKEVSDRADVCIHCGAPLNIKNGQIKIKCCDIDGSMDKVKIINKETREVLAKIRQRCVVDFTIKADTLVRIKYPRCKTLEYLLPFKGTHCYEIIVINGFLLNKVQLNEVSHIGSAD